MIHIKYILFATIMMLSVALYIQTPYITYICIYKEAVCIYTILYTHGCVYAHSRKGGGVCTELTPVSPYPALLEEKPPPPRWHRPSLGAGRALAAPPREHLSLRVPAGWFPVFIRAEIMKT